MAIFPLLTLPLMAPQLLRASGRAMMHDGVISMLRTYSPAALRALGQAADPHMIVRTVPFGNPMLNGVVFERPTC